MCHRRCAKAVLLEVDGESARLAAAAAVVVVLRLLGVETDGETGRHLLPRLVAMFLLVHAVMPQLVRAKANRSRGLLPRLQLHPRASMCPVT